MNKRTGFRKKPEIIKIPGFIISQDPQLDFISCITGPGLPFTVNLAT
jgi:hypothetical protein